MVEQGDTHRPNIHDPHWDTQDKLAYLQDLRNRGVPAMPANRGKLLDLQGKDRSDLIPEPPDDGGLSPMLNENMAAVAAHLEKLIAETHAQLVGAVAHEGTGE